MAIVDSASGDAGAMPDEGPPKTVKTKESLRGTLPKKPADYQVVQIVIALMIYPLLHPKKVSCRKTSELLFVFTGSYQDLGS